MFELNNYITSCFYEGKVTIFIDYYKIRNYQCLDLYAHYGTLNKKIFSNKAGKILTEIKNDTVYITDFNVNIENHNNGKILFFELIKIIIFEISNPIKKVSGFLSPIDFNNWIKLIYFYNHLDSYVSQYINVPISLDFDLRDYKIHDFISKINNYKTQEIYFDILIIYQ